MEKPFVVCHMFTSVNGKIDGEFIGGVVRSDYGRLRSFYRCGATLYGTVTARAFAGGAVGKLDRADLPKEDRAAPTDAEEYLVAVDPEGTLAWRGACFERPGRPKAHVIEAMTERATPEYLAYLRRQGVSYVFVGKDHLDAPLLLQKLKTDFGVERLMLAGGGYINGTFLREGLIDEISLVLAPAAEGSTRSVTAFEDFWPGPGTTDLTLLEVQRLENGGVWLRYVPKA